jgi:hypothetical protein
VIGLRPCAAAGLALLATSVAAQAPGPAPAPGGKVTLKDKVKPGLYENQVTSELIGVPGIAAEQQKATETQVKCITAADIDKGIDLPSGCAIKMLTETPSGMQASAECRDGSKSEFRIAATSTGFTSEFWSGGKGRDGKPFSVMMRTEGKYLGDCKK